MLAACNLNHRLGARPVVKSSPGYALSPNLSKYLGQFISLSHTPLLPFVKLSFLHLNFVRHAPISRRYAPMIGILVRISFAFSPY